MAFYTTIAKLLQAVYVPCATKAGADHADDENQGLSKMLGVTTFNKLLLLLRLLFKNNEHIDRIAYLIGQSRLVIFSG